MFFQLPHYSEIWRLFDKLKKNSQEFQLLPLKWDVIRKKWVKLEKCSDDFEIIYGAEPQGVGLAYTCPFYSSFCNTLIKKLLMCKFIFGFFLP